MEISEFFQVFFDEAEELLAEKERLLLGLDPQAFDMADIDAVFRVAHSIKGGAATFGLSDMTGVTHVLESLLDRLRKGEAALTPEHIDTFLAAKDVLQMQLRGHRDGAPVDAAEVSAVLSRLQSLSAADGSAPVLAQVSQIAPQCLRSLCIALPQTDSGDLEALASELALLGRVRPLQSASGLASFMLETAETAEDVKALCSFIIDPDQIQITEAQTQVQAEADLPAANPVTAQLPTPVIEPAALPAKPVASTTQTSVPAGVESSSLRVSIDKVDQLINLVGELVITQAMIEQRTNSLDPMLHEKLLQGISQLTRNTRHLQEAVMSIRMMPMDYVFSRFPRMARDLATKLGKKIDFVTQGAATELDKGLIERIIDPLTHLVRNSIDHGIEMPEARMAAGKEAIGKLTLPAALRGGHVVIEVSDDGGGLRRDRILAKARQQGLAVADSMSDADVWQLIFAPGFSTAEAVTDVSGRGVGMDVVKRNITALGGQVDIRSQAGQGTTVSIALPLTLAILDGMSVRGGEEIYILPLNYVLESVQPRSADISHIAGQGQVIRVRGEYVPLISLRRAFCIGDDLDPVQCIAVILEAEGRKAALLIDALVGQQQVVVKNLEANYRRVPGVSGATILGDGSVALILDVSALLRGVVPG